MSSLRANIIFDNKNRKKFLIKKLLTRTPPPHTQTSLHTIVNLYMRLNRTQKSEMVASQDSLEFHLVLRRENITWTEDRSENSKPREQSTKEAKHEGLWCICVLLLWHLHVAITSCILAEDFPSNGRGKVF